MKEIIINKRSVFPIGLGTFGYGEEKLAEQGITEKSQIDSMLYSFDKGINYVVAYLTYANGKAVELLAQAISQTKTNPYITFCAYPYSCKKFEDMEVQFKDFLRLMKIEKVDTFMLPGTFEGTFGRDNSQKLLDLVLKENLADTIGVNNFNNERLDIYYQNYGKKIVLHEIGHNFEIRVFEDLGIIQKGKDIGIQTIVYQPLRRNRTALRNWPLLAELSKKYNKTQNQIILNWLNSQNFLCLTKAANPIHIDENIDSLSFEMDKNDIVRINEFRPVWDMPKLNWLDFNATESLHVSRLSNVFDDLYID